MSDTQASAETAAARLLGRRPMFEGELRRALHKAGHSDEAVAHAVERLRAGGQIDDLKLAMHVLLVRSTRSGRGRGRLEAELVRRGVSAAVVDAAWDLLVEQGDLDPADLLDREVRKRLARDAARPGQRQSMRVYNALVRAGFDPEAVEAALRSHGVCLENPDESFDEGRNDDIG